MCHYMYFANCRASAMNQSRVACSQTFILAVAACSAFWPLVAVVVLCRTGTASGPQASSR